MAWFPCNIGGGSPQPQSQIAKVFLQGSKISTTEGGGSYIYPSYPDISSYNSVVIKIYATINSVYYENYVVANCDILPQNISSIRLYDENGNYWNQWLGFTVGSTSISSISYQGNWETIYIDMIGINEDAEYIGNATVKQGTFVSASSQYGIVDVDCGFKPDMVMVRLPFGNNDTTSYWEKGMSWAETNAMWNLYPAETVTYFVDLDRQSGETGIQAINDDGFSFMSNGGNTQGVTCEYIAVKYEAEPQPEPEDRTYLFKDGEWKNQTILTITTNSTTIEDGKLKCTGTFSGIVVSDVSGLDTNDTTYNLYFKLTNSDVGMVQNGRCNPTQNLSDIIQYGTDRISYNNDYLAGNTNYEYMLTAVTKTSGVFFGNASSGGTMYIDEIWIDEIQSEFAIRG